MTSMQRKIVETSMMREAVNRTVGLHPSGGTIWWGTSGIGKTVTARRLVEKISRGALADSGHESFNAVHYHAGEITADGNVMKKAIKSLFEGATRKSLERSIYLTSTSEGLAAHAVQALQAKNIEMILVDDANLLLSDAIRAMTFVADIASHSGHKLSLVFIGDETLPIKIKTIPSLLNSAPNWFCFEEHGLDETWEILAELHPYFRTLDRNDETHVGQVKYIHEVVGGYPGRLVKFLQLLHYDAQSRGGVITERFLYFTCRSSRENLRRSGVERKRYGARHRYSR